MRLFLILVLGLFVVSVSTGCKALEEMTVEWGDEDTPAGEKRARERAKPRLDVVLFKVSGGGNGIDQKVRDEINLQLKGAVKAGGRNETYSTNKFNEKVDERLRHRYDRMSPEWVAEVQQRLGFKTQDVFIDPQIISKLDVGKHVQTGKVMKYQKLIFSVRICRYKNGKVDTDYIEEYGHILTRKEITERVIAKLMKAIYGEDVKTQVEEEAGQ
jgi:hypothetical protein